MTLFSVKHYDAISQWQAVRFCPSWSSTLNCFRLDCPENCTGGVRVWLDVYYNQFKRCYHKSIKLFGLTINITVSLLYSDGTIPDPLYPPIRLEFRNLTQNSNRYYLRKG